MVEPTRVFVIFALLFFVVGSSYAAFQYDDEEGDFGIGLVQDSDWEDDEDESQQQQPPQQQQENVAGETDQLASESEPQQQQQQQNVDARSGLSDDVNEDVAYSYRSDLEKHGADPEKIHKLDKSFGNTACKGCEKLHFYKCFGWKVGFAARDKEVIDKCQDYTAKMCQEECWGEETVLTEVRTQVWDDTMWCGRCKNRLYEKCKKEWDNVGAKNDDKCFEGSRVECVKKKWCEEDKD